MMRVDLKLLFHLLKSRDIQMKSLIARILILFYLLLKVLKMHLYILLEKITNAFRSIPLIDITVQR